ncbi:MAG: B12-binding domain-containing protein [Ilumatobacteraceae bacterium]
MSDDGIELQAAADQLGVHYQTAYKWVRSGQLPAALVQGRYLISPTAVAAFAERRVRPRRPAPRRPRTGFAALSNRTFDQLVAGDERQLRKTVASLVDDGVPFTTVMQELLVPALRRIGEEWQAGRMPIAVEHQVAAIVERVIGGHHPTPRGRRRGTAVVAALSNDRHALPTSMAAAALREDNWHVHHLGADLPGDELVRYCDETAVDLVVLTVTATEVNAYAERIAQRLATGGVRTLVGHPGGTLAELQRRARDRRSDAARTRSR